MLKTKSNKLLRIFSTLLLFLFFTNGVFAVEITDWQEFETEHFIIMYHDMDENTLSMVAMEAENAYNKVTSDLRYHPDNKTVIKIVTNLEEPEWVASYSVSMDIIELLNPEQTTRRWVNYESYIKNSIIHEFTHHIMSVGYQITFPDWLNEGIATYEEGKKPEYFKTYRTFKKAVDKNELLPLGKMWIFDLLEDDEKNLAYIESYTVIEYIVDEYGYDGLIEILNVRKENPHMDQVINNTLGISFEEFEIGWMNFVKEKYGSSLNDYTYIAYFLILLVAVSVIFKRVKYQNK